jgi:CHAT domain-containing protein
MYVLRERDGLTRAEAVRQAQLDLIRGRISPQSTTPPPRLRSGGRDDDGAGEGSGPWAHPFHWAPFVLMGNWL